MAVSPLLKNFSQISTSNTPPKKACEHATLKQRFSVIFPKHDVYFTPLSSTCEKILALKLYSTIFLTLGLIFLNKSFCTSFYLFSHSLGLVLTPKKEEPKEPKEPKELEDNLSLNISGISAIPLFDDGEHFVDSNCPSPHHVTTPPLLKRHAFAKATNHSHRISPSACSSSQDDDSLLEEGQDRPDLRIRVPFQGSPTPNDASPSLFKSQLARLPADALESRLRAMIATYEMPRSLATPEGFSKDLVPFHPKARVGSLPDFGALSHFTTGDSALKPAVELKRSSWPETIQRGRSSSGLILQPPSSIDLKALESLEGFKKAFDGLDFTDVANTEVFWTEGSFRSFFKAPIPFEKSEITLKDLEEIIDIEPDDLQDEHALKIGYFLIATDPDVKAPYGKILIEQSTKLMIAALNCVNFDKSLTRDIVNAEAALEIFQENIEGKQELDPKLEKLVLDLGKKAQLWIHQIRHNRSYEVALIFKDVLDITKQLYETEATSPHLYAPVLSKMVAFIKKWST